MESHHRIAHDFDRVIMKDDTCSSVTEEDQNLQQFQTFRERLSVTLESYKFQLVIVSLVILDSLLIISALLIDIRVLEVQEELSGVTKAIHAISISILALFLIEITAKIYAFRLGIFKRKIEVFDAIVVITSFSLDVAFIDTHDALDGTGLLIMLRLWKVARILNSMVMSVKIQAERKVHREMKTRLALEQELNKYRDYCQIQEQEIEVLRGLLRKHGIDVAPAEEKPVSGFQMDVVVEVNENSEKEAIH